RQGGRGAGKESGWQQDRAGDGPEHGPLVRVAHVQDAYFPGRDELRSRGRRNTLDLMQSAFSQLAISRDPSYSTDSRRHSARESTGWPRIVDALTAPQENSNHPRAPPSCRRAGRGLGGAAVAHLVRARSEGGACLRIISRYGPPRRRQEEPRGGGAG